MKVGSFPRDDTHVMIVRLSADRALRLLVVPSSVDAERGRAIMARAVDDDNRLGAEALLGGDGPAA